MIPENIKEFQADLWVFDNDGTLYSMSGIEKAIVSLMISFIADCYGVSLKEAVKIRKQLLSLHDTKYTLIALKEEGIDPEIFIRETYLRISPQDYGITESSYLRRIISELAGKRIVLTNNPSEYADLILKSLGIRDLFSAIYGMREIGYHQKPDERAFWVLQPALNLGQRVVLIDDEAPNIETAKKLGCLTLLVEKEK